jgi:ferric-dicitrate binding protein FerR (iron transport regulator)
VVEIGNKPYRTATLPGPLPDTPNELVLTPPREAPQRRYARLVGPFFLALLAGGTLANLVAPWAGWLGLLAAAIWGLKRWRHAQLHSGTRLRLDDGELRIFVRDAPVPVRVRVSDIRARR